MIFCFYNDNTQGNTYNIEGTMYISKSFYFNLYVVNMAI